MSHGVIIKC